MKKSTLWGLMFLIASVLIPIELCLIARSKTGIFDPRCAFLRSYVIVHSLGPDGKEAVRCTRDTD